MPIHLFLAMASCHQHSTLAFLTCEGLPLSSTPTLGVFECLGIQFFNSLTCDLQDAMPRQTSLILSHVTYGTLCHARGHLHYHMWLTGCYAMPEVTHTLAPSASQPTFPPSFLPPAFNVIPLTSVSYRQVFRPILYFQPSSSQSDSRLCPNPYLGKQRISLGVTVILSICLCPHT